MNWQEQIHAEAQRKIENLKHDKSLTEEDRQYYAEQIWCNANDEIRQIQKEQR